MDTPPMLNDHRTYDGEDQIFDDHGNWVRDLGQWYYPEQKETPVIEN